MDKLQEPDFTPDREFPRLLHGVEELKKAVEPKFQKYFCVLAAGSIFRYYREVFFYKGGLPQLIALSAGFAFSSYQIARYLTEDPFVSAAEINNEREREYISKYSELYKRSKNIKKRLPDYLIQ